MWHLDGETSEKPWLIASYPRRFPRLLRGWEGKGPERDKGRIQRPLLEEIINDRSRPGNQSIESLRSTLLPTNGLSVGFAVTRAA